MVLHPLAHLHWLSWVSRCQDLYAAGEKICGTDEMKFITILCTRSATHLMRGTGRQGGDVRTMRDGRLSLHTEYSVCDRVETWSWGES